MRVAVLGGGPSSLLLAALLSEARPGVTFCDIEAMTLMDLREILWEPDINPYFSLDDILWEPSMCPVVFLRELNSAPLYNSIENRCVQPFFKEHYEDE